ncbi:MAG: endonuclease [Candidatus Marinimicrobia bacterium]|nr:endonuclease [Candidatus Neomarinimicrobiota bacterium]
MKQFLLIFTLTITSLWSQIPNGYYNNASGLNGTALQQALHDIIDGHQSQSYSALWTHFQSTDVKPNGKVWDMYSDVPGGTPPYEYTFVTNQCGNYGAEGDCYNREHSWPKSWFNEGSPMYTDMFHLVPTDGYVNGQRSNYPYGETSNPSWTSLNGSKKGPCSYPGYTGTVFEPIDAYKGDFARNYFYMSTRYFNEDGSWDNNAMVNGSQLVEWALNMLLEWHAADPVSQKEIDRNNAIHDIQNNRNPFIDHPEYTALIWSGAAPAPTAPSDLFALDITETIIELSWTDNATDEDGFYLYQDNSLLTTLSTDVTSYEASGLIEATSYTFGVSAFNGSGESAQVTVSVTTSGGGGSTVTHFLEDFETGSGNSYEDGDFALASGSWNLYQSGNFALGTPYNGDYCIAINDDTNGAYITTPAVNTLGSISFYYYQRSGSATDEFQVQKAVNGGTFETIATQNYNVGTTYTLYSLTVNDTSTSVRIRILNDNQAAHLIIDDVAVTNYDPVSIVGDETGLPFGLTLHSAYPNPFNPVTTVSFTIPVETHCNASLRVFDVNGRFVESLYDGITEPGVYTVKWDGADLSSGIYLLRLSSGNDVQIQRVTLLK